jgi:uncharacterized protein YcaQ
MLSLVPVSDLPYHRLTWDRNRESHEAEAFTAHGDLVQELVTKIRSEGPLQPRTIEPRERIDWYWRPTNQVRAILEALAEAGILGISRREGNLRVYDVVENLFPADVLADRRSEREQRRHRLLTRYRGVGLLGATGQAELFYSTGKDAAERRDLLGELVEASELVPLTVEGFKGERYAVADELPILDQAVRELADGVPPGGQDPGVAFLAPLDSFCWDRDLLRRLFDFDYVWEVYVPAAKRRWGYYVLPILFGDRLVGRIEPRIERKANALRIVDLWWEVGFDPLEDERFAAAFATAIEAHRAFGGVERVVWPRTARHRPFLQAVKAAAT